MKKNIRLEFIDCLSGLLGMRRIMPMTCARSALFYGLRACKVSRTDEILVPPYVCQGVLSALSRASFPAMVPSSRTKAVLVYHQFGFPQNLTAIGKEARKNRWLMVSDCAHTLFSVYKGQQVVGWGDFSVVSFAKIFPCILGGALITNSGAISQEVKSEIKVLSREDQAWVKSAYQVLDQCHKNQLGKDATLKIASVFGYLPELVSFPDTAKAHLPTTQHAIQEDIGRRNNIWALVRSFFPKNVPNCPECDVVPWAIPVKKDIAKLKQAVMGIKKKTGVSLSVLHFDFARNMLEPDYQPALIIDCSNTLGEIEALKICEELKILGF